MSVSEWGRFNDIYNTYFILAFNDYIIGCKVKYREVKKMIMNREFIEHNNKVDYLRYQERRQQQQTSFDRYMQKQKSREEDSYSTAAWG